MVPSILSLSEVVAVVELLEGDLGMSIFFIDGLIFSEKFSIQEGKKTTDRFAFAPIPFPGCAHTVCASNARTYSF